MDEIGYVYLEEATTEDVSSSQTVADDINQKVHQKDMHTSDKMIVR